MQDTPCNNARDKVKPLSRDRSLQESDEEYFYYFKIDDFWLVHEALPWRLPVIRLPVVLSTKEG